MTEKYNHERGREIESLFAIAFKKAYPNYLIIKSAKEQDMFDHYDYIVTTDKKKTFTVEVKSLKRNNREDDALDSEIIWAELTNVRGDKGWLRGLADYIVFELDSKFVFVKRKELLDYTLEVTKGKVAGSSKKFYDIYQRYGREDEVVKLPFKDISPMIRTYISK